MDNETPLKLVIAHNLSELRKAKGLTQIQLADKFGYSDKAVSKWEHGEATPDIETLAKLADYYGVTLDYLTHEGSAVEKKKYVSDTKVQRVNKTVIIILSCMIAPLVCILIYTALAMFPNTEPIWTLFVWWVPIDAIICFVFNCIWGPKRFRPMWAILMSWTIITAFYLEMGRSMQNGMGWNLWIIFLIGVPLTIAAILWNHVKATPIE